MNEEQELPEVPLVSAESEEAEAEAPEANEVQEELEQAPAEAFDSKYRKVLVTARRARQLQSGSAPLVASKSYKACRVAQDEINAGAVKHEVVPSRRSTEKAENEFAPVLYIPPQT